MEKTVYCVIGEKRVGKDTVADYICSKTGATKFPLAEPLKELVCNVFQISMEDLDKFKNEYWDIKCRSKERLEFAEKSLLDVSFRSILQKTGDSMKEFFGLDCFMKKVHQKLLNESVAVIPDVRLKEEQEWLTTHANPIFIKIVRDIEKDKDSQHRTEIEVNKLGYDILVENNGTIDELYKKIDSSILNKNK